jgi:hypothetical protein
MGKLIRLSKQLQQLAIDVAKIFSRGESISSEDKKRVINIFVEIDKVKKSIVSLLFSDEKTSARDRILAYFKDNVGKKVTSKELSQIAGISEYARRIRELRHEYGGWNISTGLNRPDLKPDEYVLENLEQRPIYERMNAETWAKVLKRDNFTCQVCGWKKGDPQTNNRKFLEVHHINPVCAQGEPTEENLVTLCNVCHDSRESKP